MTYIEWLHAVTFLASVLAWCTLNDYLHGDMYIEWLDAETSLAGLSVGRTSNISLLHYGMHTHFLLVQLAEQNTQIMYILQLFRKSSFVFAVWLSIVVFCFLHTFNSNVTATWAFSSTPNVYMCKEPFVLDRRVLCRSSSCAKWLPNVAQSIRAAQYGLWHYFWLFPSPNNISKQQFTQSGRSQQGVNGLIACIV